MIYDLAIIGGGPAGYTAAFEAVKKRLKVILFEKGDIGGTCLNRGCVPTKFMAHVGEVYKEAENLDRLGINGSKVVIDSKRMHEQQNTVVNKLRDGLGKRLLQQEITVIKGNAKIIANDIVEALGTEYQVKNILVATGSSPTEPIIKGALTSDDMLKLDYIPSSLVIVGGGVVAVEFAHIYNALGTKVTMCLRGDRILRSFDRDIANSVALNLKRRGVVIKMNCKFDELDLEDAEVILSAIGRTPNIKNIFGEDLDIKIGTGIITDEFGRTSMPNIYAAGDVIERSSQLAHVAMEQGKRAVKAMQGEYEGKTYSVIKCVYINPEIAMVGLSEDEAKRRGIPVITGKQTMGANARSMIATEERGFIKLIANKESQKIIGAQLMCERACDIVTELAMAIDEGYTVSKLLETVRPHPSYCETISEAAEILVEKMI